MCQSPITNIDISKEYDESLGTDDVHYQSFARMAAFFGRDMQAHRHDQYFQMHFLDTGQIELQLDDHRYSVQAPLFVLTPPSVPHAFITESDSDGHVLTVREDLIWPLLEVLYPGTREAFGLPGICLSLADKPDELAALKHYWQLIARESTEQLPGREHTLVLLAQAVFTLLLRNAKLDDHASGGMRGELKLFQRFNQLTDAHYHEHWTVPEYASELHLTESRLTDICRRFANRSPKRLIFDRQQRDAIAEWSRLSYGWMGRTPDYKAAFGCALGANPAFYGQFEQNARNWYTRIQETGLYFNHAIVNPPIDRHKPADEVKDVYIKLEKETDAGIIVSGAKVVATNSALTHYNMIGFGSAQVMGENPDFALMFVAPMDAEGVKLISRASYEMVAGATGSPYDYPLSSRFDENDAILVMDHVLIPWENVLIYRDFDRCRRWTMEGGFARMYPLQACVRLAVKLDFITALLKKSLECTGTLEFRGVQADLGEVVAWRNMFWALSDSMCSEATPWVNGAYLPDHAALQTYRVMAPMAYAKIKNIIERNVTSGLIYLPSSARDLNNPQIDQYLAKYVRGSNGMDHVERIKILKLMWDAIGSEFGGRHELYEINYSGSQDEIRLQCLRQAQSSGNMDKMMAMVDRCMSEYDQHGWTVPHLHDNTDINMLDKLLK